METTYALTLLDNGITLADDNGWIECEKSSDNGSTTDQALINFIGSVVWPDILNFTEQCLSSKLKLTIKIEPEK